MYALSYDLWKEIVEDIVLAHQPLFEAMLQTAEDLTLTPELIRELQEKKEIGIPCDPWEFDLTMEPVEDHIEGFVIFLVAHEPQELMEELKEAAASERGFSSEEILGFELEHGLNMQEEILEEMEELYDVRAEVGEDELTYELVVFDSQDIDDSQSCELIWQEGSEN